MATKEDSVQLAGGYLRFVQHHRRGAQCALPVLQRWLRSWREGVPHRGPEQSHDHVARLRQADIDVEQAVARGQLDVLTWPDVSSGEIALIRTPCWPLLRGC